jgi:hypothetical protein
MDCIQIGKVKPVSPELSSFELRGRFVAALVALVLAACSGEKVQTPTSDRNYDDEGAPGSMNDPAAKNDGGHRDGAASDANAAPEAASDAAPESGPDAAADAGAD